MRYAAILLALGTFSGNLVGQSDSAQRSRAGAIPPAHSLVIAGDSARSRSAGVAAQIRSLLDTTTVTLERLEVHKTSLAPGASPHPPHRHPHEELMLVERGTLEVLQEGAVRGATAGALIFEASNELHGLKNIGADTATYWVIAIYPRGLAESPLAQGAPLFIRHVTVVDVVSGWLRPDMSVEIRGRTISAIDSGDRLRVPPGATLIEGRGKYLIPGLWDMHVHLSFPDGAAQIFLPMMVANGVLGARDMHSFLGTIVALKRSVATGAQIGPRLFIAGTAIDGPSSYLPAARIVHTPDEARQAVRDLRSAGVDFIKVYSSLPKDLYLAVAAEAKSEGIPFLGHVPYVVTAAEASDAGQRSLEHLTEVDVGTSRDEAAIKAEEAEAMSQKHGYLPDPGRLRSTFDSAKAAALFDRFRRNDTWQVPTLVVLYQEREVADSTLQRKDSLIAYIPKLLRNYWRSLPVDIAAKEFGLYGFHAGLIARLERAGVPMLAGSDTPNPFVYPGFSLHDELALLVRSGLTPAEALRTATINPARFLGVSDSLGTVAVGKMADLVLLDGNPLADIANTKRIRAVIQGGRVMNRAALDSMLARARARAAAEPPAAPPPPA